MSYADPLLTTSGSRGLLAKYNELSQKTRFQTVPIAALCGAYLIYRVKTWFLNDLYVPLGYIIHMFGVYSLKLPQTFV